MSDVMSQLKKKVMPAAQSQGCIMKSKQNRHLNVRTSGSKKANKPVYLFNVSRYNNINNDGCIYFSKSNQNHWPSHIRIDNSM